jgi:hypothetical protein
MPNAKVRVTRVRIQIFQSVQHSNGTVRKTKQNIELQTAPSPLGEGGVRERSFSSKEKKK